MDEVRTALLALGDGESACPVLDVKTVNPAEVPLVIRNQGSLRPTCGDEGVDRPNWCASASLALTSAARGGQSSRTPRSFKGRDLMPRGGSSGRHPLLDQHGQTSRETTLRLAWNEHANAGGGRGSDLTPFVALVPGALHRLIERVFRGRGS